jgi:hypothetical protein
LVGILVAFFDDELELFVSQLILRLVELSKLAILIEIVAKLAKSFDNFVMGLE